MAEIFENLDNILRDWAKDRVQKKSSQGIELVQEVGRRRKIKPFLQENDTEKDSSSRARPNQAQNWSW